MTHCLVTHYSPVMSVVSIVFTSNLLFSATVMETTQDQPQWNKDDNPTVIQLQTIVIVNTTVVHGEHSTNGATSSGETVASSDNNFASNYNLFTESTDTNKKCYSSLSCIKFAHVFAIVLTICVLSGLFTCPIIAYVTRDTFDFTNDENFNEIPLVCCIALCICIGAPCIICRHCV